MSQETKNSTLDSILKQYETNSSSSTSFPNKFDEKNYFSTFLPKGVNNGKKVCRILKPKDGSSPFVEINVHKKQVNGEWKTFPCLKHEENKPCPFCEARELLLGTGKDSDKEIAKSYSSKKAYVVKVIDREKEEEGVKFWRFNHDYRKTGTFDKLIGIIQEFGEIYDSNTGRDLIINIARDGKGIPNISGIVHKDQSKLTTNREVGLSWINDERTWKDVYSVKPYEYLEIIVKGGTPAWDKVNNKWADKESLKSENVGNESDELNAELETGKAKSAASTTTNTSQATPSTEESDDLPF
jgi:hypothetical protein